MVPQKLYRLPICIAATLRARLRIFLSNPAAV
jgi:hypothetical protein